MLPWSVLDGTGVMPISDENNGSAARRFRPHSLAVLIVLLALLIWAGTMLMAMRDAALPGDAGGTVMAVFPLRATQEQILSSVVRAEGRPVRVLWPSNVWVVNGDQKGFVSRLKNAGAIAVYGELPMGPVLAGCFAYVESQLPIRPELLPKP